MPRAFISCTSVTPRRAGCGPGSVAVLQVEVAHRQADDVEAGLRHQVQRVQSARLVLHRQRAAMADDDRPSKPVFEHFTSAMSRSVATLASIVSSTWKSASSPRAAAMAKKPFSRRAGRACG
jgi:hypothetical protein